MAFDYPVGLPPGDPPPATAWGFSGHIVMLVRTREQALATIRFLTVSRKTIIAAPLREMTTANNLPHLTAEDTERWNTGDFSGEEQTDVIMRALKVIALDPVGRADTLLSLQVHIAYLCGRFGVQESTDL